MFSYRMIYLAAMFLATIEAVSAQTIDILDVKETSKGVEVLISTDMTTPFEVMGGIGLAGQAPEDVWIGNNQRFIIRAATQTLLIKPESRGNKLPSGTYEAEVNFYPRWGAKNSPAATKSIRSEVTSLKKFELRGSGESAARVAARENNQRWVMENTAIGDHFNHAKFEKRLGTSSSTVVKNRNGIIVAHYFVDSDITIFENTLKRTLVTWRLGKHTTL